MTAGLTGPAAAMNRVMQDGADGDLPPVADLVTPEDRFRLDLGYEWQGEADLDSGGTLDVQRAAIGLGMTMPLEGVGTLSFDLDYELSSYDFGGNTAFAEEWEDVHQFAFAATVDVDLDNDWSIFGGPLIRYAGESGADLGDSLSFGGFAGLRWNPYDELTLGLGIALYEDVEDNVRVVPVIELDWQFTTDLTLRTTPTSFIDGSTEFELAWRASRDFELSGGAKLNSRRRFRLDDAGTLPDAVGQEEGRWLYVRGTWDLTPNTEVAATVGLSLDPDLRLESSIGAPITETSYGERFTLGARLTMRF
jgi:hypothetical protein